MQRKLIACLLCLVSLTFLSCTDDKNTAQLKGDTNTVSSKNTSKVTSEDIQQKVDAKNRQSREKLFNDWFYPSLATTQEELVSKLKGENITHGVDGDTVKIHDTQQLVSDVIFVFFENGSDKKATAVSYAYFGADEKRIGAITKTDIGNVFSVQRGKEEPQSIKYMSEFKDFLFDGILSTKETAFYDRYFDMFVGSDKSKVVAQLEADKLRYEFSTEYNQIHVYDNNNPNDTIVVNFKDDGYTVDVIVYIQNLGKSNEKVVSCKYVKSDIVYAINKGDKVDFVNKLSVREYLFSK